MKQHSTKQKPSQSKGYYIKKISEEEMTKTYLFETAWEVCNQVGGIYTVIKSKVPSVLDHWDYDNYVLFGPYFEANAAALFEPIYDSDDPIAQTVDEMNKKGHKAHYGTWLIEGRPKAVLFDFSVSYPYLGELKYLFWEHHGISLPDNDELLNQIVLFGHQFHQFLKLFTDKKSYGKKVIAHFHEWMGATPIPEIRRDKLPISIVFTTHATMLGRYLAMNDRGFYSNLPTYDWEKEAKHFNIEAVVHIERAAAHGCHVFTTVSEITGEECKYLLGREPDLYLPNGLNIDRFEAMHEFQNLHLSFKEKINEFVRGHFFQSYSFDLNKTLYFFTSGRYEYVNKGYDLTLEALARLNYKLKQSKSKMTVVMFFITRNPISGFNPQVLQHKALMEEIQRNCDELNSDLSQKLFNYVISNEKGFKVPDLNSLLDDYTTLKIRRNIQYWKSKNLPTVITHELLDEGKDEIMNFLKGSNLLNLKEDRVKIVYHPDFISTANPLFRMEYYQFIRGCHLGVFPSYYEPWGYTPLECCASGIPSVTSDLAGFGSYVANNIPESDKAGLYVINRKGVDFHDAAENLANLMFRFVRVTRRDRITQRNKVEATSIQFDWNKLGMAYLKAYGKALRSVKN
jgi:glycogen(starch) synthase